MLIRARPNSSCGHFNVSAAALARLTWRRMNALTPRLSAYLERLGIPELPPPTPAGLAALARAQSAAIAFESLDAVAGVPISIAPEKIVEKILGRGRGGYCFELNGLFGLALEIAGFRF